MEISSEINFCKRSGTTDHGKNYEDLLIAFTALELTLNENVANFSLSSNDEKFGDFDDVVIRIEYSNKKTEQYAIQVKHNQRKNLITKNQLAALKGNFSLQKYSESYQKMEFGKVDRYWCVLYTCATFDIDAYSSNFYLDKNKGVKIRVRKEQPNKKHFFNIFSEPVYKFSLEKNDNEEMNRKYKKFLRHFLFYPNQKDVDGLKASITEKFCKDYDTDADIVDKFVSYITEWSERERNKSYLNKRTIKRKIGEFLLSSYLRPNLALKNDSTLQLFHNFDLNDNIIILETEEQEMFLEEVKHSDSKFTVVELPKGPKTSLFKAISLVLQNSADIKYLLIVEDIDCENFENLKVFQNLHDVRQNSDLYNKVCNMQVSLQGRPSVLVSQIFKNNQEMEKCFKVSEIMKIAMGVNKIGEEKEELPDPYIKQVLLKTMINVDFLYNNLYSFCVLSCTGNVPFLSDEYLKHKTVTIDSYLNNAGSRFKKESLLIVSDTECSLEQFQQICSKNPSTVVHHFRLHSNNALEWIASNGTIQELLSYRVPSIGFQESEVVTPCSHMNVICSQSGMGKSVMMKYLKNNFSCDYWTIYVQLRDHASFFKTNLNEKPEKLLDYVLKYQTEVCKYKSFEKRVREQFLLEKRVVILWDGLDELSDAVVVSSLLKVIQALSANGYICWITTRPNFYELCIKVLNVFPLEIQPVKTESSKMYIQQYLKIKFSGEKIQNIMQRIERLLSATKSTDLLGIPLQLKILTQLFYSNPQKYLDLTEETFSLTDMMGCFVEEKIKFGLSKIFSLEQQEAVVTLLEEHKDFKILQYKHLALQTYLSEDDFKTLPKVKLPKMKKDIFEIITNIDNNICSFFHNSYGEYFVALWFSENFEDVLNFQNFFFKDVYKNIRKMFDIIICRKHPVHLEILYGDFENIAVYNNQQLELKDELGQTPVHLLFSYGQSHPVLLQKKTEEEYILDFDAGNRVQEENFNYKNAVKVLLNQVEFFLEDNLFQWTCLDYAINSQSLYVLEESWNMHRYGLIFFEKVYDVASLVFYAVKFKYTNIFQLIDKVPYFESPDNCNLLHQIPQWGERSSFLDKIFENEKYKENINRISSVKTPLLVIKYPLPPHLSIKSITVRTPKNLNVTFRQNQIILISYIQQGPLYFATFFGDYETAKKLVEQGADVNSSNNMNMKPLAAAIWTNQIKMVMLLVEAGAFLNQYDSNGENELHLAVRAQSIELVKYFLEKDSCIAFNRLHYSPLDVAILSGQTEIAKILLTAKHFQDALTAGDFKYNALIPATLKNDINILRYILDTGVITKSHSILGYTPLHIAAKDNRFDILEELLKYDFDVDSTDKTGLTPLNFACLNKHYDIVELLITKGADVNKRDISDNTPLHHSCAIKGNVKIVKYLLPNGAELDALNYMENTALIIAADKKNEEVVQLLIEKGANVEQRNVYGYSTKIILQLQKNAPWFNYHIFYLKSTDSSLEEGELHPAYTLPNKTKRRNKREQKILQKIKRHITESDS